MTTLLFLIAEVIIKHDRDKRRRRAGYEVMPLYRAYAYPGSVVLDNYYFLDKNRISAVIKLKHWVEMMKEGDFGRRER